MMYAYSGDTEAALEQYKFLKRQELEGLRLGWPNSFLVRYTSEF